MKELAIYQLEVALCITALSGFYLLFWKKETNFIFKRFLLISIPLLSVFIPLLNFNITLAKEQPVLEYMAYIPNQIISQSKEFLLPPNDISMLPNEAISQAPATISMWQVIVISWILVAFFMLLRLTISFWKIWKISQEAKSSTDGNYKLVDDAIQSFSFFNLIVINKSQAGSSAKEHILAHEQAHSSQGHSFDVLFMEIIKVMQWFNPFMWIITNDCKQNLEFLADQAATTFSEDKEPYQYAIVHHATNSGYQLLKTQFSKTNLKSRIIMMNQPGNRKIPRGKLLVLLPLLGALLMSFSIKVENLDLKKELTELIPLLNPINLDRFVSTEFPLLPIKEVVQGAGLNMQQTDLIAAHNSNETIDLKRIQTLPINGIIGTENFQLNYVDIQFHPDTSVEAITIAENRPRPSTGDMLSYYKKIKSNLKYPKSAKKQGIKGKVFVEFIVRKDGTVSNVKAVKGISPECDAEAIRVISEGPTWIPGEKQGKKVDVRMIIPIPFGVKYPPSIIPYKGIVTTTDGEPLAGCKVVIEGTKLRTFTNQQGIFHIKPKPENKIVNLVVSARGYKTKIIFAPYGSSHAIELKRNDESETRKISGTIKTEDGNPVIGCNVIIKGTKTGTVSDGNGKYLIEVQPEHTELVFSYVGLLTETLEIKKETVYNIVLKADPEYTGFSERQNTPGNVVVGHPVSIEDNRISIKDSESLNGEQPLVILDGKEILHEGIKAIDPNDIESISVLKDKSAVAVYGDKGANGVILITSKSGNEWKRKQAPFYTPITIYDDNNKEGLKLKTDGNLNFDQVNPLIYFKDGVEITKKEVERIDPHTIDNIEVIKGKAAKEKYGKKGKNGVILIKMKE